MQPIGKLLNIEESHGELVPYLGYVEVQLRSQILKTIKEMF